MTLRTAIFRLITNQPLLKRDPRADRTLRRLLTVALAGATACVTGIILSFTYAFTADSAWLTAARWFTRTGWAFTAATTVLAAQFHRHKRRRDGE